MYIYKAAVVGAGTMGAEIAQVITFSGLPVVLKDIDSALVKKGLARVRDIYQHRVDRGRMDARDMESKLDLLEGTTSYDSFADVDIVIEAIPEKMEIKKRVLAELDATCPPTTIFASNTSALSISEMAAATRRPDRVVGLHFFNPAHVMKLVEVIPGFQTSEDTVDTALQFAESLRKIPVRVQECAGFLVNRLLMPYLNEAVFCLQEGTAAASEIDAAVKSWGMPMGPFILADMLGLDVCWDVAQTLYAEYGERMRPAELMQVLADAGRLGEKSGQGFYLYGEGEDDLPALIAAVQAKTGRVGTGFSVDRLILPLINEAVICLQENVARAKDVDMAMLAGTGMPKGPLALADERGLDDVLAGLEQMEKEHGLRFHPAPLLRRKVRAGQLGKKTGRGFHEYAG